MRARTASQGSSRAAALNSIEASAEVTLINGPTMAAHPTDPNVLYFVFGTYYADYGTDLFRYDASTKTLTMTHNRHHDVNAIAFAPGDPDIMYLGLEHVGGDGGTGQ